MPRTIELSREQLYEAVWSKPVSRLVEEFAISDRGLAKLCARRNIPTPPRGYWARLESGRRVRRVRLPPSKDTMPIELMPARSSTEDSAANDYEAAIAELRRAKMRVPVAERLSHPCALVDAASNKLRDENEDELGIISGGKGGCLDVRVSRSQLPRALRIADALIKAFADRDWPVAIEGGKTLVRVGDIALEFTVYELLEHVEVPLKPKLDEEGYEFHYDRREVVQRASQRLAVRIGEPYPHVRQIHRRNWCDSERQPLEGRLHQVVIGVLRLASGVVADHAARERELAETRAREEARKNALEERQRLRDELSRERAKLEWLLHQTHCWHRSQDIRRFVKRVREEGVLPELETAGEELEEWIGWALEQADRLDPFRSSPPSVLDRASEIEEAVDHRRGFV